MRANFCKRNTRAHGGPTRQILSKSTEPFLLQAIRWKIIRTEFLGISAI